MHCHFSPSDMSNVLHKIRFFRLRNVNFKIYIDKLPFSVYDKSIKSVNYQMYKR